MEQGAALEKKLKAYRDKESSQLADALAAKAADRALNVVCNSPIEIVKPIFDRFRARWAEVGRRPADMPLLGLNRHCVIAETDAEAQQIAERDPFALKFAKASVNETMDAQGFRAAMEGAFKNYMMTIPHRMELGTYGPKAREKDPKDRFAVLNKKGG